MTLSIIIPFKDRAPLVERMLGSLSKCSEMPDELIFVDNGSQKEAKELVKKFVKQTQAQHPECRVTYICKPTGNACAARNAGLDMARGEWVYFFDSDDELSPEFVTDVKDFIHNHEGLDLVGIRTNIFANGKEFPRTCTFTASPIDQILCTLLSTQSMLIRRPFLLDCGGWNECLPKWNDWELGLRILLASPRMKWITKRTYHRIYIHEDSITGKDFSSTYQNIEPALMATASLILSTGNSKLRRAWAYRATILAGHIAHEGNAQISEIIYSTAQGTLKLSLFSIFTPLRLLIARSLYRHTAKGGRGAWRIARLLIRI